jgi:hypothetical protein
VQGARATLTRKRSPDGGLTSLDESLEAPPPDDSLLMAKFLLLSVLIMTVAFPMRYAKTKNPKVGLKRTLVAMTLYIWFWVFYLVYIHIKLL